MFRYHAKLGTSAEIKMTNFYLSNGQLHGATTHYIVGNTVE
jgi:hypothetical protein